jgi:hypothetical protein
MKKLTYENVPSLPDDIAFNDNCLTAEQERTAALVIEAATWAIHAKRIEQQKGYEVREYAVVSRNGYFVARCK